MFLYILSWVAMVFHVVFLTLALAAALYYLAELVEEYTVLAARVVKFMLVGVTLIYIGLLFEGFPTLIIVAGLFSSGIYFILLRDFPFIQLISPIFIIGIVMVFVNHYLAFSYFAEVWYPFSEILAYFTLCLWLLPFTFFVSLSASENVLPTSAMSKDQTSPEASYDYPGQKANRRQGILALFNFLSKKTEGFLPTRTKTF